MLLDTIYKSISFGDLFIAASPWLQKKRMKKVRKLQEKAIEACRKKEVLSVVFFLQSSSIWKYDSLYKRLMASDRFKTYIVVSPYNVHLNYDTEECFNVMKKTLAYAKEKGYNPISAYDFENKKWIDIKKTLNPDIVFFTKPYKDTLPKYHLYHFQDKLTLHAPYGIFNLDIYHLDFNLPFHNLLWRYLVETTFQKRFAEEYSLCKGDNIIVVGALGCEQMIDPKYHPENPWKPQDKPKKRIIWAPHHTVDYLFNFSNFMTLCDQMVELAEKFHDQVQIAFKPHPILKFKLINLWGKEKTETYYQKWANMPNTQLEEGYYIDLFLTSDAMIHDCVSFTTEYLFTRKPVLFIVRDQQQVESHWNPFGKKCYDHHYHARGIEDIEHFITDTVITGNDPLQPQREVFFRQYLFDGKLPSENIYNFLYETTSPQP